MWLLINYSIQSPGQCQEIKTAFTGSSSAVPPPLAAAKPTTTAALPVVQPQGLRASDSEQALNREVHRLTHELEVTREEFESALGLSTELGLALVAAATSRSMEERSGGAGLAANNTARLGPASPSTRLTGTAPDAALVQLPQPLPPPVLRTAPFMCPWPQRLLLSSEESGNISLTFGFLGIAELAQSPAQR